MAKMDNMLSILWLLKSRKRMTAKELANELEMHIRTVYRYIDALCASGVPIIADSGHNGGYQLLHDFVEIPLFFNSEEQKAMIHAARFAQEAGYPLSEILDQALEKLKRYTNEDQRENIERYSLGLDVIQPPFNQTLQSNLQQFEEAVSNSMTLEMAYQKEHESSGNKRKIDPYGMVYWLGKWYVVAYCHLRGAVRSFRVDRVQSLKLTERAFERPSSFNAREFFLNNLLTYQHQGDSLKVRIEGHKHTLTDLCNHWFLGHTLMERSDTQATFLLDERTVTSFLPHIILSYGKSIKIIEPQLLRDKVVALTSDLQHFHQSY